VSAPTGIGSDEPDAPVGGSVTERAAEREFTVEARSQSRMVLHRFLQHKAAVISGVLLILAILVALIGGRFWKYSYDEFLSVDELSQPPSLEHPMGTTSAGRDSFAQVLRGAQKSVQIALTVALVSTTIGTLIGCFAGFYRGFMDSVLMRFTDLFLIIPPLIFFAMLGRKFAGSGWLALALCLAALSWTSIARVVRGVFLSLREKEYVEAARALGASNKRIIFKHLLPNAVGPIIVNATITVAVAILVETSLSFLGLGVQAPDTSLGSLISDNQQSATTRPWLFYFPGFYIILIALTVNFLGDGLRDAFDPTQRRVRA
jgi:peptide/nickel transport system permease protein